MFLHTDFLFKGSLLLFVNCIQTVVIQLMLLLYEFIVSLQYYIREGFSRKGLQEMHFKLIPNVFSFSCNIFFTFLETFLQYVFGKSVSSR